MIWCGRALRQRTVVRSNCLDSLTTGSVGNRKSVSGCRIGAMRIFVLIAAFAAGVALWAVTRPPDIPFEKHTVDLGANETCVFADVNSDGKLDIVSGENWYEN